MANFKSDIITAKDSVNLSDKMVDGDRTGGLLLLATAQWQLDLSAAAGDTIQIFDLPAGAVIVPALSQVHVGGDPGTTLTLDVGDAADPNRYADTLVCSNGGEIRFNSGTMPIASSSPYRAPAQTRIFATVKSASGLAAAVGVNFTIAYRVKG